MSAVAELVRDNVISPRIGERLFDLSLGSTTADQGSMAVLWPNEPESKNWYMPARAKRSEKPSAGVCNITIVTSGTGSSSALVVATIGQFRIQPAFPKEHAQTLQFQDDNLVRPASTALEVKGPEVEVPWLASVYEQSMAGQTSQAVLTMYHGVEDLFTAKNFRLMDSLLESVDLRFLTAELMVGMIRATYRARLALPAWRALLKRIEKELQDRAVPNWDRLLVGLPKGVK